MESKRDSILREYPKKATLIHDTFWELKGGKKELSFLDEQTFYWCIGRLIYMGFSIENAIQILGIRIDDGSPRLL